MRIPLLLLGVAALGCDSKSPPPAPAPGTEIVDVRVTGVH